MNLSSHRFKYERTGSTMSATIRNIDISTSSKFKNHRKIDFNGTLSMCANSQIHFAVWKSEIDFLSLCSPDLLLLLVFHHGCLLDSLLFIPRFFFHFYHYSRSRFVNRFIVFLRFLLLNRSHNGLKVDSTQQKEMMWTIWSEKQPTFVCVAYYFGSFCKKDCKMLTRRR